MFIISIFGILIIVFSWRRLRNPSQGWERSQGWKVEGESEPSENYLVSVEISCIFGFVFGAFLVLLGIFKMFY